MAHVALRATQLVAMLAETTPKAERFSEFSGRETPFLAGVIGSGLVL